MNAVTIMSMSHGPTLCYEERPVPEAVVIPDTTTSISIYDFLDPSSAHTAHSHLMTYFGKVGMTAGKPVYDKVKSMLTFASTARGDFGKYRKAMHKYVETLDEMQEHIANVHRRLNTTVSVAHEVAMKKINFDEAKVAYDERVAELEDKVRGLEGENKRLKGELRSVREKVNKLMKDDCKLIKDD